jgi:hypothetical protein
MTIKSVRVDTTLGYGNVNETYGGQELHIQANPELTVLLQWWKEWAPVFMSMNDTVKDALTQVKVVHELSKEQDGQPKTYTWNQTSV